MKMRKRLKMKCLSCICAIIFVLPFLARAGEQKKQETGLRAHKQIVEKVEVTNVEVPVRVFHKGQPVAGLQKDDFKLLVNGKEVAINGFYQDRKTIVPDGAAASETLPSRLFLLIFNTGDYHTDISRVLDTFFSDIFKPGDRLMVLTNNFFFDDREILKPGQEKKKLEKVLKLEARGTREIAVLLERKLKNLKRNFLAKFAGFGASHISGIEMSRDDFVYNYTQLLAEFKNIYLTVDTAQYARLAIYLKEQKVEKWVLSFYQVGRFFKPRYGSDFLKKVMGPTGKAQNRYTLLQEALEAKEELPQEDLGKLFANSGAAFHTLLLENKEFLQNDPDGDLSYIPIVSDTYNLLGEIAKKTGGTFIHADEAEKFYGKIAGREDIFYMLTYAPPKGKKKKKAKIKVLLDGAGKGKGYRISYDNQRRGRYLRKAIKKNRLSIPHIRIEKVEIDDLFLSVIVADFSLKHKKPKVDKAGQTGTEEANDPGKLKLPLRLQVFDRDSKSLFDGVEMFDPRRGDLEKARVRLKIRLPVLPDGIYDFFIWVGDPLTGKRDLAIKEVAVPGSDY